MWPFHRDIRKTIVVVDERTYRLAIKTVDALLATGTDTDRVRAQHGLIAAQLWLRAEIQTGRKSKRAERAARLEQLQLRLEQVNTSLGLPASFAVR
jgi:hypothetical protein